MPAGEDLQHDTALACSRGRARALGGAPAVLSLQRSTLEHLRAPSERGAIRKEPGGKLGVALVYPNAYRLGMANLGLHAVYRLLNDDARPSASGPSYPTSRVASRAPSSPAGRCATSTSWPSPSRSRRTTATSSSSSIGQASRSGARIVARAFRSSSRAGSRCRSTPSRSRRSSTPSSSARARSSCRRSSRSSATRWRPGSRERSSCAASRRSAGRTSRRSTTSSTRTRALRRAPGSRLRAARRRARARPAGLRPRPPWPATSRVVDSPDAQFGDLFLTEVARGCLWGCRFCAAGFVQRPYREVDLETLRAEAKKGVERGLRLGLVGPGHLRLHGARPAHLLHRRARRHVQPVAPCAWTRSLPSCPAGWQAASARSRSPPRRAPSGCAAGHQQGLHRRPDRQGRRARSRRGCST